MFVAGSTAVECGSPGVEAPDVESSSERYALRFSGPAGEYLLAVQTRIMLELVSPWPGATVLDVGGGHGQAALPLAAAGHKVTVLGSCEPGFERLNTLLTRAPGAARSRVSVAAGDLCDPPFADRSFDVVVALRMMPHVRDWRALLAGLCRVARHAVIVDFPTPVSANALEPALFALKKGVEGDTRRYAMMRARDVRATMERHGMVRTTTRAQFFWPMVVHRALHRPGLSRALEGVASAAMLTRVLGSPIIMRGVRADRSLE